LKDIDLLIKNSNKYKDAIIQKKYKSKKNTVAYITLNNKPKVVKWFAPGFKKNMDKEYSILSTGYLKLNIPTPFEKDQKHNVILMSYIIGENLCDLINDENMTTSEKQRLMLLLSEWFSNFHNYFRKGNKTYIRGDSILRNFIFSNKIWGVDFENSRYGKPDEDISQMCASILSTDPMFTDEKIQLCNIFIKNYERIEETKFHQIDDDIAYFLLEINQRRSNNKQMILDYANKIKETGLY